MGGDQGHISEYYNRTNFGEYKRSPKAGKKNAEGNVEVCDLKQKTMQALNTLAVVYATFENASANLEVENSERDMLHADVRVAMEEFNEAQQNQERMRGELQDSRKSLDVAFMDMQESMSKLTDCRDLHDAACRGMEDVGKRTIETKQKADDAHDQIRAHWGRCCRATAELVTAEEDLNDCLGLMGRLIKNTVGATHAFHCSVPDRDSYEVRSLQEALDMIEDFQRRGARPEMAEVILVERQR